MAEHALWVKARTELSPYGVLQRLENRVGPGTPDLLYTLQAPAFGQGVTGLLELKHEDAPIAPGRLVMISTLTKEQVDWARQWARAGGRVHCLLQAGPGYWLLAPDLLADVYAHRVAGEVLADRAVAGSHGGWPADLTRAILQPAPIPRRTKAGKYR